MNNLTQKVATVVIVAAVVGATAFHWTVNRFYVEEGQSLQLRYKGPLIFGSRQSAKPGHWAAEGEIGILEKMRGPGRHFYSPIWFERILVDDVFVEPGEVGVVTCKLGQDLSAGEYLVDGDIGSTKHKGILRKVLHPGRYRINPYGYTCKIVKLESLASEMGVKHSGWVEIPTGYVGVVTNLAANPITGATKGVQENV